MALLLTVLLAAQDVPRLAQRVEDRANVLTPDQARRLTALLEDLERRDSTQVVVLTVPTTAPLPIEQFAHRTAETNGIGRRGKNNGALIVLAVADRRVRIEVGYGLEPVLTDALASRIIQREMIPRFKAGDTGGGLVAGAEAVVGAVRGTYKAEPRGGGRSGCLLYPAAFLLLAAGPYLWGRQKKRKAGAIVHAGAIVLWAALLAWTGMPLGAVLFVPLFMGVWGAGFFGGFFAFWGTAVRMRRGGGRWITSGGGGGWSGGSSWSSGGGGGFSGGGGSFGGGGASGSW